MNEFATVLNHFNHFNGKMPHSWLSLCTAQQQSHVYTLPNLPPQLHEPNFIYLFLTPTPCSLVAFFFLNMPPPLPSTHRVTGHYSSEIEHYFPNIISVWCRVVYISACCWGFFFKLPDIFYAFSARDIIVFLLSSL